MNDASRPAAVAGQPWCKTSCLGAGFCSGRRTRAPLARRARRGSRSTCTSWRPGAVAASPLLIAKRLARGAAAPRRRRPDCPRGLPRAGPDRDTDGPCSREAVRAAAGSLFSLSRGTPRLLAWRICSTKKTSPMASTPGTAHGPGPPRPLASKSSASQTRPPSRSQTSPTPSTKVSVLDFKDRDLDRAAPCLSSAKLCPLPVDLNAQCWRAPSPESSVLLQISQQLK